MKKLISLLFIVLITTIVWAQSPQKMSYQVVVRNSSNQLMANQVVGMKIGILQGSANGNTVYTETQTPVTNANGLVSIEIGGGAGFNAIDWGNGPYFLKTETDPTGGSNYTITGTSQLLSVPYALHAKTAESIVGGGTETDPVWTAASVNYYTKPDMQTSGTSQLHFNNLTNKPTTVAGYGITDAMTTAHPANGITTTNISNWNTAFGWGNHAGLYRPITYVPSWGEITSNPFLFTASTNNQMIKYNASSGKWENWTSNFLTTYTETDPVWTAASGNYYTKTNMQTSGASQLHFNNLTNKPTTVAGYGITDAMTTAHPANGITATNIINWNTAFGWGNHAGLYRPITYVPSWGEITYNPFQFTASTNNQLIKYNASSGKWENWTSNFLTAYTETDPLWTAASVNYYTKTNMQTSGASQLHFNNLTNKPTTVAGYGITDAMTTAHPANSITATNISSWNTAYGWGNHAGLYRPISYVPTWGEITSNPFVFNAPVNNQLIKYNSTSGKWENWTSNFLTTYTETDPIWTAASVNYYTKNNMQTSGTSQLHFNNLTNKPTTVSGYGITDAMTTAHPANVITASNISNWNTAYGWGNHATAGYQPLIAAGTVDQYYRGDKTWQPLFAGTGGSYGSAATAARTDHVHDAEYIVNQTATAQSAGFNITSSGTITTKAKNTNASGIGVTGIGNNTTYSGFPAYSGGGAFLGSVVGVYGQVSNTTGERAGGYFRADGNAYAWVGGYNSIGTAKLIWGIGTLSSSIRSQDGLMADLSATLNPENVITDYGVGKLINGQCRIDIDPIVVKRIYVNKEYPIKVFIQLEGECNGVFVSNKSASGFDVIELMGGKSDVTFSWTFTANLNDVYADDGSVSSKNLGTRAKEYSESFEK